MLLSLRKRQARQRADKGGDDGEEAGHERLVDVETEHAAGAGVVKEGVREAAAHGLQRLELRVAREYKQKERCASALPLDLKEHSPQAPANQATTWPPCNQGRTGSNLGGIAKSTAFENVPGAAAAKEAKTLNNAEVRAAW